MKYWYNKNRTRKELLNIKYFNLRKPVIKERTV